MTGSFCELEGQGFVRLPVSGLRLPDEVTLHELRRLPHCWCPCATPIAVYRFDDARKVWVRA